MTAAKEYTWDFDLPATPARAASLTELGDAALADDAAYPPIPPEMPYADQLNQWALQLAGLNRVIHGISIAIHFTAGTPAIQSVAAMSSLITTTWAQANIIVTDNGTGDTTLTWPVGALPNPRAQPSAYVNASGPHPQPEAAIAGSGVRVKTWNMASAATDLDFTVIVY